MARRSGRSYGAVATATARAVIAGLAGAVIGIAAYSISQTGGQWLSIVVGGVAGVAIALGADFYRRSVQLTEVRLVLPGSEMTFLANTDMRQAALRMFFQAATRVSTRPLDDGSGNLREALTSLKTLFDLYREPLESGSAPPPPATGDSVHALVLDMLNFELAPFLAYWHPRLRTFEEAHPDRDESAWEENAVFREALRELQRRLRPYVIGLGEIAGVRSPEQHLRRSDWYTARHTGPLPSQGTGEPANRAADAKDVTT